MGASTPSVNDDTFQTEVLMSAMPVLVDFWAPWCGPCRQISPMIDQLATEYASTAKVVKVNVDEAPRLSATFGVESIPTLMVFKAGNVVARFLGGQPKTRLQAALDEAIG